jgi:hypothetical protein
MSIQLAGVQLGIISGGPSSITLEDLADVSVVSPATGQALVYNASLGEWQNAFVTATTATNLAGGAAGSLPYQSTTNTTAFLAAGAPNQVLISGSTPSWSNTPALTGTNFTGIPNSAFTNSSITIGSTNIALGASNTSLAGLTSVSATTFTGAFSGIATDATNVYTTAQDNNQAYPIMLSNATLTGYQSPTFDPDMTYNPFTDVLTVPGSISTTSFTSTVITGTAPFAVTSTTQVANLNAATAGTATNLAGGTAGSVSYQTGTGATAMLALGTTGYILTAGATAPSWAPASGASVGTATNLAGGDTGEIAYQSAAGITIFTAAGTSSQVLSGGTTPTWTNTPTLSGTNFTSIPNAALTNNSITIGSTSVALGASSATLTGLTSVSATTFTGAFSGIATDATNVYTTAQDNNQAYPIMLSNATVTGYQSPTFDIDMTYNPFTDVLTVPGSISTPHFTSTVATGTAPFAVTSTTPVTNLTAQYATNATNVAITSTTTNAPFYITLSDATSGNQPLDVDLGFTLNPSTSALTVPGTITVTSGTVTNLTTPVNPTDAATKAYVDAAVNNVNIHPAVEAATTVDLGSVTYTAGVAGGSPDTGTGVGATLTNAGTQIAFAVDGYTTSVGSRVLIKNQATTTQNGVYVVTNEGSGSTNWLLTRASDYNNSAFGQVVAGDYIFVQEGTTQKSTSWVQTSIGTQTNGTIIDVTKIGTDAIVFTQFSGAGSYTSGTGLSLTGTVFANTGVLSVTTNSGLSTNTSATGNVTITNTGVLSIVAGTNISVSSSTGNVTVSVTGTVPSATTATNFSGTTQYSIPYQSSSATTGYLSPGTVGQVLVTNNTGSAPIWSNTPTLTGTNFSGTAASLSIGGTAALATSLTGGAAGSISYQTASNVSAMLALGTTGYILTAGATAPTWAPASGASVGTATNIAGGAANSIPYQSATATTVFLAQGTGVLSESAGAPTWTTTPTLTGTNFTGIPNTAFTNSSITIGSTNVALGATAVTLAGLTSVTSTSFVGALTGNASSATNATNLIGGLANQISYQTASSTNGFITAPTVASTFLEWNGSAFVWAAVATGTVTAVSVASANGFTGTSSGGTTPALTLTTSVTGMLKGNGTAISAGTAGTDYVAPTVATTFSATQTFNGSSSTKAMQILNATETVDVIAAAPSATQTFYVASGAVQYYTTAAANNWTINFAWSSGTSFNTATAVGDSVTVAMMATQGATAYYATAFQIDGTVVTPKWLGGTAPTSGNTSGIDVYTFTIIKTASATYTVIATQTQYK